MRGKKTDTEFLSSFITQCVMQNKNSSEQIIEEAKSQISDIDQKIQEVEKLKIVRSKLLGVIDSFEKPNKNDKHNEVKILSFFKIQNPTICKYICNSLKNSNIKINGLQDPKYNQADIMFSVKQLIEHKVIYKTGDVLLRGDMFQEYMKFVLQESI